MRAVTVQAPFTDGLVTDVPAHLLGPRMASQAENMIVIDGVARRRRGWKFTTGSIAAAMAAAIDGIRGVDFSLASTSRRAVTTQSGTFDESAGTNAIQAHGNTASAAYDIYPRCVYRDELILCHAGGQRGIIRYAGAGYNDGTNSSWARSVTQINASGSSDRPTVAMSSTSGQATFTYTLPVGNPAGLAELATLVNSAGAGWFLNWDGNSAPIFAAKIANVFSTSNGTLLQAIATGGSWSQINANVLTFGTAYPAVSVYGAGSATISSNTATGVGTEWLNGDWGGVDVGPGGGDNSGRGSILITDGTTYYHRAISAVSSDTALTTIAAPDIASEAQYHITRSLPFADACVWKRSLIGTGVVQYPNRVYICPPDWDLESPPGSVPPLRMEAASFNNTDANYFLVDFVDVPSTVDTDACVAVLPTPGPLLVLKKDSCHGIYGDYPSFSQALLRRGAGCIDMRSTVDCRWGQFWAGREGIYWFTTSQGLRDITADRINGTWRDLVATYYGESGFYCAMGQSGEKLFVSIGDATAGKTLCFDVQRQRWDGYVSNHQAVYFDAPRDDARTLLWAAASTMSDPEKLRDSGAMVAGAGPVNDGALLTTAAAPVMTATTATGLARAEGIDGLAKMVDVAVSAEVSGPATGHAKLTPSAVIAGGIDDEASSSTSSLPAIEPDASGSTIQRASGRIHRKGRTHAVKVDTTSTPSASAQDSDYDVIVHQITASFTNSRERA